MGAIGGLLEDVGGSVAKIFGMAPKDLGPAPELDTNLSELASDMAATPEQAGQTLGDTAEADEKRKTVRKKRLGAKKLQIPLEATSGGGQQTTASTGVAASTGTGLQI
jgi:hypothetical protein